MGIAVKFLYHLSSRAVKLNKQLQWKSGNGVFSQTVSSEIVFLSLGLLSCFS